MLTQFFARAGFFALICYLFLWGMPPVFAADKALVVGIQSGATSLDARQATDAASSRLLRLITLGLVELDGRQQAVPSAAERIEQTDALTYKVWLKDMTYHDGTPFTAESVKALYDSIRLPESTSPLKGLYAVIKDIQILPNNGLEFTLNTPNPFFWNLLLRPLVNITDATKPTDLPIGLGPYKVAAVSEGGDVTLTRAKTWQGSPPKLDRITFKVVPDPLVRLLKLRSGEVDLVQNDIPDIFYRYGLEHGLKGQTGEAATYTYLGFNLQDKLTGDIEVRKALAHALDTATMVEALLGGRARPARSVLPEAHPGFWPAPSADYNPAKAAQILDEAGYKKGPDGVRFSLTFSTTNNPSILLIAQVMQQQLKAVGIDLKITSSEWGTFYGNIKKGNFQLYLLSWVGLFNPDFFQYVFHSSMVPPSGANRGRYMNAEMDRLIDTLMQTADEDTRNKIAVDIQKRQHADVVYIPLWRRDHVVLMRPDVTGYAPVLDGGYDALLQADIVN